MTLLFPRLSPAVVPTTLRFSKLGAVDTFLSVGFILSTSWNDVKFGLRKIRKKKLVISVGTLRVGWSNEKSVLGHSGGPIWFFGTRHRRVRDLCSGKGNHPHHVEFTTRYINA